VFEFERYLYSKHIYAICIRHIHIYRLIIHYTCIAYRRYRVKPLSELTLSTVNHNVTVIIIITVCYIRLYAIYTYKLSSSRNVQKPIPIPIHINIKTFNIYNYKLRTFTLCLFQTIIIDNDASKPP